ncbi:DUF4062 domain-containing protein [Hyphomicrobium sp. CS1BSMeth3]|uniref:DUF4062 domain-containing protein n=1 Tax=Hyphomicrobium sp. CS1BSMeth3 TaxID=1892844 RepID=UPI00093091FB|nr:DUF4062 domain-containing protein [Hyphomicrobium sp. CS1BSMeth3]
MERRYQIFVSSTFADLLDERRAVSQALLNLNHFPAGMALFPASNEDQWTLIRGVIDDSDYYVLVIGGRYGSTTEEGLSYTEKEFDYAVSSGKPVLAFLHENPDKIESGKTDQSDAARRKLAEFRKKAETGRHVKYWSTADNLETRVLQAVSAETKRNPQEGWVRASLSGDPMRLNELNLQIEELKKALSAARYAPPPGTEQYAQGADEFLVSYKQREYFAADWEIDEVPLKWDQIFYEIGPMMLREAAEEDLSKRLASEICHYGDEVESTPDPEDVEIAVESFETIIIQLNALGLIRKSEIKHVPSDRKTYWQLTPFGENYLMRLRAKKKGETI